MKTFVLLGYGTLGKLFMELYEQFLKNDYKCLGVFSVPEPEDDEKNGYRFFGSVRDALDEKPDYLVEFAGVGAVKANAIEVLENGTSLIAASIGAYADSDFYARLREKAMETGSRVYIPSGAVGGFDLLRTMALDPDMKMVIENVKAPGSLGNAPYLEGIEISDTEEQLVFEGTVREAIEGFPKNVNVAVAAALAGGCEDSARVTIVSQPGKEENTHRIKANNSFACADLVIESLPNPANPGSSSLAAWSVAALLKNMADPVEFF